MDIQNEIVEFTKELVRIPSQNYVNSETAMAEAVAKKLKSFGFSPKIIGPEEHPSVICSIGNGDTKTIWLEAPLDTVPAGDESKWEHPPLEATMVGNKMYGRGVADSKVAIAIFCYLANSLANDSSFHDSLFLGFDADEQTGNFTGIREVVKHAPKADVCILGYQGIEEISIGARGWLRVKLTTHGKSAHTGSRTNKGKNAIHAMGKAIVALNSLGLTKKTEPFFEFGSTLNIAQINGGVAINIVPDKCEANIDIRLMPSQKKEAVLEMIKHTLQEQQIEFNLDTTQYEPAYLTNPDNQFVKLLQTTATQTLGKSIPLVASGQGSVGNVVSTMGIPIINAFGCESSNVHASNEWLNVDTIPQIFSIYRDAITKFCK